MTGLLLITLCCQWSFTRSSNTSVGNIWFHWTGRNCSEQQLQRYWSWSPCSQLFWTLPRYRPVGPAAPVDTQACFSLNRRTSWTTWQPDTCPSKRGGPCRPHHVTHCYYITLSLFCFFLDVGLTFREHKSTHFLLLAIEKNVPCECETQFKFSVLPFNAWHDYISQLLCKQAQSVNWLII